MWTKFLVDAVNLETLYLFFYFLEIINELQNSVCSSQNYLQKTEYKLYESLFMVLFVFFFAGQPWSLQTVFVR